MGASQEAPDDFLKPTHCWPFTGCRHRPGASVGPARSLRLVGEGKPLPAGLAARLAEALAQVFSAPIGRVWIRLTVLPAGQYAENLINAGEAPLPVFVRVLHADLPPAQVLATQAQAVSLAVAACLQCASEHVHVEYAPAGRGRVAFGGRLLVQLASAASLLVQAERKRQAARPARRNCGDRRALSSSSASASRAVATTRWGRCSSSGSRRWTCPAWSA